MHRSVDIAVIGAGVLGTSVAYWLAARSGTNVCVIEAEAGAAKHASSRNTGVIHSPFYLDPRSHSEMADAMIASQPMWRRLASRAKIPYSKVGLLEVATTDAERSTLEAHMRWGVQNGIEDGALEIVEPAELAKIEPNVRCVAALRHKSGEATDFGRLTTALAAETEKMGAKFVFGFDVASIERTSKGHTLKGADGSQIDAKVIINCGGGRALEIARMMGQAEGHTALHFRGEYWRADASHSRLVGTSVYSVPRYPEYPFLDPHWIVRADGSAEVGPNAVPVASPVAYDGCGGIATSVSKIGEILRGDARRLLFDATFLRMACTELKSSVSKSAMILRIRAFIPSARPEMFTQRGESGIRTPIVTPDGKIASRAIELLDEGVCSIINYNSPGATGAPAYAARLVGRLADAGHIRVGNQLRDDAIWTDSDLA